jgi:small-conductance mechanosensitive channel
MNSSSLLFQFLDELQKPAIGWQVVAIAVSIALAWALNRLLQRGMAPESGSRRLLGRIGLPLIALLFLFLATLLVRKTALASVVPSVLIVRAAMLLLATFSGVRLTVYVLRSSLPKALWLASFERLIVVSLWTVLALFVTGLGADLWDWLNDQHAVLGGAKLSLADLITGLLSLLIVLLLALWAGSALEARLMRADTINPSTRAVLSRSGKGLLILIGVLVGLPLVGIPLTALGVFGGALGVGLGIGLQRIASNYVSGFIILLDRSIKLGDMITVDKYYGKVIQINARYTVVQALDSSEAIIPNEMLVSTPVQNLSYSNPHTRVTLRIGVAYDTDIDRAMRLMLESAGRHARVIADPPAAVLLVAFAADGIELELGFYIADPENGQANLRSDIAQDIWREFKRCGVQVPFPQRVIHFAKADPAQEPRQSASIDTGPKGTPSVQSA